MCGALGGETVVEDLVEAVCFGLVAVYGVGDFFRCVWERISICLFIWLVFFSSWVSFFGRRTSEEVVRLTLHRSNATLL